MNDFTLLLLIVALSGSTGYEMGYQRHATDLHEAAALNAVALAGNDADGESAPADPDAEPRPIACEWREPDVGEGN